jgi:hypothetical protein
MSIKTPKRLVLGVIAALVFAPFAAIAPASAAAVSIATSDPVAVVSTATTGDSEIGPANAIEVDLSFDISADVEADDTVTFTNTTISLVTPAGSTVSLVNPDGAVTAATGDAFTRNNATNAIAVSLDVTVSGTTGAITGTVKTNDVTYVGTVDIGTVSFRPDVAGTYKVILTTSDGKTATYTHFAADLYAASGDGLTGGNESNLTVNGVAGPANFVTLTYAHTEDANKFRQVRVTGSKILTVAPSTGVSLDANN